RAAPLAAPRLLHDPRAACVAGKLVVDQRFVQRRDEMKVLVLARGGGLARGRGERAQLWTGARHACPRVEPSDDGEPRAPEPFDREPPTLRRFRRQKAQRAGDGLGKALVFRKRLGPKTRRVFARLASGGDRRHGGDRPAPNLTIGNAHGVSFTLPLGEAKARALSHTRSLVRAARDVFRSPRLVRSRRLVALWKRATVVTAEVRAGAPPTTTLATARSRRRRRVATKAAPTR